MPLEPLDKLLCSEVGRLSVEDIELLRRELRDPNLNDRDGIDGIDGSGFSNSLPNSLNSLSSPGCICRAIIGKWFSKSLNDLTSFFRGKEDIDPFKVFELPCSSRFSTFLGKRLAGTIVVAS